MITRDEVAARAGVSVMTVTRVVSGKGYVAPETRRRVEGAIEELNYIPNKLAADLIGRKSRTIAVVLRELTNPYYIHIVDAMIDRARSFDCLITLFKTDERNLESVLTEIISNRVMGVVNLLFTGFPKEYVDRLEAYGIKSIFTGGPSEFRFRIDYEEAIRTAMFTLRGKGIRHPAFLSGLKPELFEGDTRVKVFGKYCREIWDIEPLILKGTYPDQESFVVGRSLAAGLLERAPETDAIFCLNDMMAFGAMKAVIAGGRRVPEDVSVVGCDNILMSDYFNPSLSTISVDIRQEATHYVDYFVNGSPHEIVMKAGFVERKSTRK